MESMTSAEERAARAAEELAGEGLGVTAAAVRARSGVRMATAHDAAKAWKERRAKSENDPAVPLPAPLEARSQVMLSALWGEARSLAQADFEDARAGWVTKLAAADEEVATLTRVVDEVERGLEATVAEISTTRDRLEAQVAELGSRLDVERSRADKAEATVAELGSRLDLERSRADKAEAQVAELGSRTK